MNNFKQALTDRFEAVKDLYEDAGSDPESWPWQFLSDEVFNFTLYDAGMDKQFASSMLEVIAAILERKTFDYQAQSDEKYKEYLTMVNMPFLKGLLNWGGSVRGAWLDEYGAPDRGGSASFEVCCGEIVVQKKDIKLFMSQLLEWSLENAK